MLSGACLQSVALTLTGIGVALDLNSQASGGVAMAVVQVQCSISRNIQCGVPLT